MIVAPPLPPLALPPVDELAEAIRWPASKWAGNCHGVACKLVERGILSGIVTRGLWIGPIHPESYFAGRPLAGHTWIRVRRPETTAVWVVDPTRFAFEAPGPPRVWQGYERRDEYDRGGDQVRRAFRPPRPDYDARAQRPRRQPRFGNVDPEVREILGMPPLAPYTMPGIFYLANLSLDELGSLARPAFAALVKAGLGAAIPVDNREAILGEERA